MRVKECPQKNHLENVCVLHYDKVLDVPDDLVRANKERLTISESRSSGFGEDEIRTGNANRYTKWC